VVTLIMQSRATNNSLYFAAIRKQSRGCYFAGKVCLLSQTHVWSCFGFLLLTKEKMCDGTFY
ncbi:hypothetical protein, partial [Lacticaseibacillus paracasei]|uniref:hypothetical protein n=1 Tax=Lacticaseibacillus paracasei TaxID=1597 RepID=UPI001F40A073